MLLIDALCMIEREYYFITKGRGGGKKKWRNKRDSVFLRSSLACWLYVTFVLIEELSFERKDRRFKAINLIAPFFLSFFLFRSNRGILIFIR